MTNTFMPSTHKGEGTGGQRRVRLERKVCRTSVGLGTESQTKTLLVLVLSCFSSLVSEADVNPQGGLTLPRSSVILSSREHKGHR